MSENTAKKSLPESVTIGGFVFRKLYLGDYFWLLGQLDKLPEDFAKSISGLGKIDEIDLIVHVAKYIPKCSDVFVELLARSTGVSSKDGEEVQKRKDEILEKLDLNDAIDILSAIWEMNDFSGLWEKLKKKIPSKMASYLKESQKTVKDGFKK